MIQAGISMHENLDRALEAWEEWSDEPVVAVAGFPRRSIIATISEMHLTERGDIPDRPGKCPFCQKDVSDVNWHVMRKHPEHDARTVKGRQTRAARYYSPDDNPVAEAVEAAVVFMGETRPDLYHVLVADRLWLVPRFANEWQKRRLKDPLQFQYLRRETWRGETETDHRLRLARALGMGLTRFFELRAQAKVMVGTYLDLNRRYQIIRA